MPGLSKDITLSNSDTFKVRRPSFWTFAKTAKLVQEFVTMSPSEIVENTHKLVGFGDKTTAQVFVEILQDAVQDAEKLETLLNEGDYEAAFELWDAFVAFGEFETFFENREKQRAEQLEKRQQREVNSQRRMMEMQQGMIREMQENGLLPKNFTVLDMVNLPGETPTVSPSTSTSTPPLTVGAGSE